MDIGLTPAYFKDNIHLHHWPHFTRKTHNTEPISNVTAAVHQTATGAVFASIPASTIPALIKNPLFYALGAVSGIFGAFVYTCCKQMEKRCSLGYFERWKSFLNHTMAIRSWAKGTLGSVVTGLVSGNTYFGIKLDSRGLSFAEGFLGGIFVGNEACAVWTAYANTENSDNTDEEQLPLNL
jgi:hypothetical protein